eukprot:213983-Hanusia_phi.AAC.1
MRHCGRAGQYRDRLFTRLRFNRSPAVNAGLPQCHCGGPGLPSSSTRVPYAGTHDSHTENFGTGLPGTVPATGNVTVTAKAALLLGRTEAGNSFPGAAAAVTAVPGRADSVTVPVTV